MYHRHPRRRRYHHRSHYLKRRLHLRQAGHHSLYQKRLCHFPDCLPDNQTHRFRLFDHHPNTQLLKLSLLDHHRSHHFGLSLQRNDNRNSGWYHSQSLTFLRSRRHQHRNIRRNQAVLHLHTLQQWLDGHCHWLKERLGHRRHDIHQMPSSC